MDRSCEGCDAVFSVSERERNQRRWCNAACRIKDLRRRSGAWIAQDAAPRICPSCGVSFQPYRGDHIYCQPACGVASRPQQVKDKLPAPPRPCRSCGVPVTDRKRLCERCLRRAEIGRTRRKNVARRGAPIVEVFDVFTLGDRDGWVCHLCQEAVDPDESRMAPLGATVDHLRPVSLGGVDALWNVKLAHRSCNVRRSNRMLAGQL